MLCNPVDYTQTVGAVLIAGEGDFLALESFLVQIEDLTLFVNIAGLHLYLVHS